MQQDESVMSVDLINAQYHLAESWRALLLVAANYHVKICNDLVFAFVCEFLG